jgi:hypothetical protein
MILSETIEALFYQNEFDLTWISKASCVPTEDTIVTLRIKNN